MNASIVSLLAIVLVALLFAAGWFLAFVETKRLRLRNEELADRLTDVTAELSASKERSRNLEDAKTAMSEQFQLVSHQAMQASSDSLLKRAEESFVAREKLALERMNSSLKPVSEHLTRFEAQVKAMEEARAGETGGLKQQISDLLQASIATREVTQKLAGTLRRGAGVQGKWGEEVLRNVLQAAGLSARFDFVEQYSLDGDSGRLRPDVVVRLPGEKTNGIFVIDSKVNLTDYLQAAEAVDEPAREAFMRAHTQAMRNHVRDLSAKAYWDQFRDEVSPDFVAMFIPGDGLLSAALEYAPDLMTEAMDRKVIIVTPTTLFALCKAVAYGWRVEDQMKNASQVADLGRELYKRLSIMGGHVADVGTALGRAVDKYNAFVGSLDSQVLTQAKKFEDLQVEHQGKPVPELQPVENQPRTSNKLKQLESSEPAAETLDF